MKKKICVLAIIIHFCADIYAQDPSFSQFAFNKLYFNPAFSGDNSCFVAGLTGRSLWQNVPSGFYTSKISADYKFYLSDQSCGLGIIGISDVEGEGFLKTASIGVPFAIGSPNNKKFSVRFGMQPAVLQNSIDWTQLKFSNQYDPVNGLVRSNGLEDQDGTNKYSLDLSAGILGEYRNITRRYWSVRMGASAYHLNRPDISYYKTNRLPVKMVYHIDATISTNAKNKLSINPALVAEQQGDMQTIMAGTNVFFMPFSSPQNLFVGLWYRRWRNSDAVTIDFGTRIISDNMWKILLYYNYDITGSTMVSTSGGSHEAGILYEFDCSKKIKVQKIKAKKCSPDAGGSLKNKTKTKRIKNQTKINKKPGNNVMGN